MSTIWPSESSRSRSGPESNDEVRSDDSGLACVVWVRFRVVNGRSDVGSPANPVMVGCAELARRWVARAQFGPRMRARRSGSLARPYPALLISLTLVMWPSTGPVLALVAEGVRDRFQVVGHTRRQTCERLQVTGRSVNQPLLES